MSGTNSIFLFDRARRRAVSRARPDDHFLATWAGAQITDRLRDVRRDFPAAVTVGPDGMFVSVPGRPPARIIADEEFFPFAPQSLDLVTSNLGLHATNDLPGTLIQIRRALKPDGLFLAALFGGETLHELRAALTAAETEMRGGLSPRIFPFADKPQMGALLQRAQFALPVVDSEILTVTYTDMFALVKDLRMMGESNIILSRDKKFAGKDFFRSAAEIYAEGHSEKDGRIRASFEIIFLIGWSPHESQQKPLSPGSAKTRLADVLESKEIKVKMNQ